MHTVFKVSELALWKNYGYIDYHMVSIVLLQFKKGNGYLYGYGPVQISVCFFTKLLFHRKAVTVTGNFAIFGHNFRWLPEDSPHNG